MAGLIIKAQSFCVYQPSQSYYTHYITSWQALDINTRRLYNTHIYCARVGVVDLCKGTAQYIPTHYMVRVGVSGVMRSIYTYSCAVHMLRHT